MWLQPAPATSRAAVCIVGKTAKNPSTVSIENYRTVTAGEDSGLAQLLHRAIL